MNARALPTLRQVLDKVHFRVTLFAAGLTGLTVLLTGFATIAFYANQNLHLVANTASYAVAPAVVFNDAHAIAVSTTPIGRLDGVGRIVVADANGRALSDWHRLPRYTQALGIEALLTQMLFSAPSKSPILHRGAQIGTVTVYGEASPVMVYIGSGLVAALACLALTAIAAHYLAGHMMRRVVEPLAQMEHVAHSVREARAFDRRVPPAGIEEINNLAEDFNALLGELDVWHHEMRRENADLSHRALHDPLTGLANRAQFERAIETRIESATEHRQSFAIIYLDGDGFKRINDQHGHCAGDVLLKVIAGRLRGCVRPDDLVARLGGDEFAILLALDHDALIVDRLDERIRQALVDPVELPSGEMVSTTLSAGAANFPENGVTIRALLQHADAAMYARKRARKHVEQEFMP